MFGTFWIGAVAVGDIAHLCAGFGEKLIVFWPSFLGAGLASSGTQRNGICGDKSKHFVDEFLLATRGVGSGVNDVGEVTCRVERAFEADPGQRHMVEMGAALHEDAHEVVGDEVDQKFLLDEVGSFAAQNVHGHERFDLMEVEFDLPAFAVERTDGGGGIGLALVKKGSVLSY